MVHQLALLYMCTNLKIDVHASTYFSSINFNYFHNLLHTCTHARTLLKVTGSTTNDIPLGNWWPYKYHINIHNTCTWCTCPWNQCCTCARTHAHAHTHTHTHTLTIHTLASSSGSSPSMQPLNSWEEPENKARHTHTHTQTSVLTGATYSVLSESCILSGSWVLTSRGTGALPASSDCASLCFDVLDLFLATFLWKSTNQLFTCKHPLILNGRLQ